MYKDVLIARNCTAVMRHFDISARPYLCSKIIILKKTIITGKYKITVTPNNILIFNRRFD